MQSLQVATRSGALDTDGETAAGSSSASVVERSLLEALAPMPIVRAGCFVQPTRRKVGGAGGPDLDHAADAEDESGFATERRQSWARLLRKAGFREPFRCSRCSKSRVVGLSFLVEKLPLAVPRLRLAFPTGSKPRCAASAGCSDVTRRVQTASGRPMASTAPARG